MEGTDFTTTVGLLKPHKPSKRMLEFLKTHFRLIDADEVATSDVSRHSERGVSATRDIVLFGQSDEVLAGQVWYHLSVNVIFLILFQALDLTEERRADGTVNWRFLDSYEFIDTASIQDPVIWCDLGDSRVRTLVPRDSYSWI